MKREAKNRVSLISNFTLTFLTTIFLMIPFGFWSQSSPPSLPSSIYRFAWFGCDSMTINGNTKVYGVENVNGSQGFGGHIGSNGSITINGSNTVAGNAYYGQGKSVTINGGQSQLQGQKIQLEQNLPCGSDTTTNWVLYAQSNNLNSQVPATYLDSNRNFTLNGNKSVTLNPGFYYFNNVTINGNVTLASGGAVNIVCTGSLTINGNAKVNQNGNPSNLVLILSSSSGVTLNGSAKIALTVFAPLSQIDLNGNVTGYGNLWGKTFIGNGSVVWNRVKDTALPSVSITKPLNGSTETTRTPQIEVNYSDNQQGTCLDISSLSVKLDDVEIVSSLTVTDTSAIGVSPIELQDGPHTLIASIKDYEGNTATATSIFTVSLAPSDTTPPIITITGVENSAWYNYDVVPVVTITDENLDPSKNVITLNNDPFVSGTLVTLENFYLIFVSAEDTFGNKSQSTLYFVIDKTPPVIKISNPQDNAIVGTTPTTITGRVEDISPESLTVNGETVALSGGGEFTLQRALNEGLNTFTFIAKDKAQNSSSLDWHISLKTTKPTITITKPIDGLITSSQYTDVEGTVSSDVVKVFVGSDQAILSGTSFRFPRYPIIEGENVIIAKAVDSAGNESQAQVSIERDTIPPKIKFESPEDNFHTSQSTITVTGTITDLHSYTATLNDEPLSISNNSFSKEVSLVSQRNIIRVSATDIAGNRSESSLNIIKDSANFVVLTTTPLNGESDVSLSSPIEVSFNNEVDSKTLNSQSFSVSISGNPISGSLFSFGKTVKFVPSSDYPQNSTISISLNFNLKDAAGNSLQPYTFSFKTLSDEILPLTIVLDKLPLITNKITLPISGLTSPQANVTIQTEGGEPVTTTADSSGLFSGDVSLNENQMNVITATATLSGQSAQDSKATLQDNIPPYVTSCEYDGNKIYVTFSEPVDEITISEVSVILSQGETTISSTYNLTEFGTKLEIVPESQIGSSAALLTLTNRIKDIAQNELIPYTKSFNGAVGGGGSYLIGEVFNDVTGLPLSSSQVEIVKGGSGSTTSNSSGSYSLPSPNSDVVLKIGGGSFSEIYRKVSPQFGSLTKVFDARLTPLNQEIKTVGTDGGTLSFLSGEITLLFPPSAFGSDTTIRVTKLSSQSLPLLLPQGFSPLCCYRIDVSSSVNSDIPVKVKINSATVPSAYLDQNEIEWVGLNPAVSEGDYLNLTLPSSSFFPGCCFVILKPDTSPSSPPEVTAGSILQGVTPSQFSSPSASLSTEPSVIFPDQKAIATTQITPSSPEPSGMPFEARFVETLDVRENGVNTLRSYSPYASDIVAYQNSGNALSHTAQFPVSPFPGIDVITLIEGKITVSVGPYSEEALGGGIIDSNGGSVSNSSGSSIEISSGATQSPIPVRIVPLSLSSILLPIPSDFEYLAGVDVSFGGNNLSEKAVIKINTNSLSKTITNSDKIFIVSYELISGVYSLVLKDFAYLDGDNLRTSSGSQTISGIDNSYFTSIIKDGKYLFLRAKNSLSFTKGKVLVDQNPVKNVLVGLISSQQSSQSEGRKEKVKKLVEEGKAFSSSLELIDLNSITYLTEEGGDYLVPFSLGSARIKAVDIISGDNGFTDVSSSTTGEVLQKDIQITPLPLTVISTFPSNGTNDVSPGVEIFVNFSKAIDFDSFTAAQVSVSENGEIVSGNYRILFGGSSVAWTPSVNFSSASLVSVVVSGVKDKFGRELSSPYTFSFTIRNEYKPKLDIGKIEAVAKSDGTMCAKGGAGSVGGGNVVFLENLSHPEYGTVSIQAQGDGSFEVCIKADPKDGIKVHCISSSGVERSYTFKQFTSEDKKSVYIGSEGGSYTFRNESGASIGSIEIDSGTFDSFTKVTLIQGDASQTAQPPQGFAASPPIQITVGGEAKKGIKVVIPLPSGMGGNTFWLTRSIKWNNPEEISPMFIDRMDLINYKGEPSLINRCDEFPGVRTSGLYQVYGNSTTERTENLLEDWGFLAGVFVSGGYYSQFVVHILGLTPFVYYIDYSPNYYLPIPPGAVGPYDLTFSDPYTGEIVYKETRTEIPTPTNPVDLGIVSNVDTRPYPTDSTPFRVIPFDVPEVRGSFSDSRIRYDLEFGCPSKLTIIASYGTFEYTEGGDNRARIEIGSQTFYVDLLPNGSFVYEASGFSSGDSVKVSSLDNSYTSTLERNIPQKEITQGLTLKIVNGNLLLSVSDPPVSDPILNRTAALYSSSIDLTSPLIFDYKVLSSEENLSGKPIKSGDVLFLAIEEIDVDVKQEIRITFDRFLSDSEITPLNDINSTPVVQSIQLKEKDSGIIIPIILNLSGGRVLSVIPRVGLSSGKEYELSLYEFTNDAGRGYPIDPPITFRFVTYGGADVGNKPYSGDAELYDIVRRGSVLYMALGDGGYDIVDVSDPSNPQSMINGPIAAFGRVRGVAIADNVPINEGTRTNPIMKSRNVMVVVGGGASQPGWIDLNYADEGQETDPSSDQPHPIGTAIGGAGVCPPINQEGGGYPSWVKTIGQLAVVSAIGSGINVIDLSLVQERARQAVVSRVTTWNYNDGENHRDISSAVKGVGIISGQNPVVLCSISGFGVGMWKLNPFGGLTQQAIAEFPHYDCPREDCPTCPQGCPTVNSCYYPMGALRITTIEQYSFNHITTNTDGTIKIEPMTKNLAFVSGGDAGILIYEIDADGSEIKLVNRIPLLDVYDIAIDRERKIAYTASYTNGIALVDISDPIGKTNADGRMISCSQWKARYGSIPYGFIDLNNDGKDDRLLGYLPNVPGHSSTLVVDSETGIVYTADKFSGTGAGCELSIKGARQPKLEFLVNNLIAKNYLSAFDNDKPQLALWMNGGIGQTIANNTLELYDRKGFPEEPTNGIQSTVQRGVALQRQSNKKTDKYYNFYLQSDTITLAMNYDPSLENPMVTRQGGSLKGSVLINNEQGFGENHWAGRIEVTKPVSRPWVELKNWIPAPGSSLAESQETSGSSQIPIEDDFFFIVGETSWFTVDVNLGDNFKGGRLQVKLKNPSEGELGGMTDVTIPPLTKQMTLKLSIKGKAQSSGFGSNSLLFNLIESGQSQFSLRGEEGGQGAAEERTSFHIKSIEWKEVKQEQFFANPNPGGGVAIYADKDSPEDTSHYDRVKVLVKLEPPVNESVAVYLRAFDVDDPSSNKSPVDDESKGQDNRGNVNGYQEGVFTTTHRPKIEVKTSNPLDEAEAEFQVTMNPGDNFRIGAVLARDKNLLDKWVVKQSSADPAENDITAKVIKDDGKEAVEGKDITNLLTVWRRLWVEWDSMGPVPESQTDPQKNYVEGEIVSIEQLPTGFKVKFDSVFEQLIQEDGSVNLDGSGQNAGNGRFENGKLTINPPTDVNNDGAFITVVGNGNDYVRISSPLEFNITNKQCSGYIKSFTKQGENNTSTFVLTLYNSLTCPEIAVNDEINIYGLKFSIGSSQRVNSGSSEVSYQITTQSPAIISYRLKDDDIENLPDTNEEEAQFEHMEEAFSDVYMKPMHAPDTTRQVDLPFVLNLKKDLQKDYLLRNGYQIKPYSTNNYWTCYILSGYQFSTKIEQVGDEGPLNPPRADFDPDSEYDLRGVNYFGLGAVLFLETTKDVRRKGNGNASAYFLAAHEVGHQFRLNDDYGNNNIMGKSDDPNVRFRLADQDFIRKRPVSPNVKWEYDPIN